jgi:D-amino peptidase
MKIFIAVDMEGATGIVHRDQLGPDGRGYAAGQKLLTADVNAAIEGALRAAPQARFVVGDGHGIMRNVLLEDLHPAAELVIGSAQFANKPLCQCEGIDDTFDLGFCVGFHSKAGTPGGLLAHTFIGLIVCSMTLNGRVVGEAEVDAAIMGSFGVPVAMVTGNSDLEPEVREWHPACEFVSTKRTLGPTAAICKPPQATRTLIADAAERAVRASGSWSPYVVSAPVTFGVETYRRETTDKACEIPGVHRTGERSFQVTDTTAAAAFATMWRALTRSMDEPAAWLS